MQASADLWFFFVLVFGVIAMPGMDMAFVASSTLTAGLRGGLAAVAGIVMAGMLHVAVGATGVASLLLWWPAAFNALLVAGAAYMAWVGWGILRWRGGEPAGAAVAPPLRDPWATFRGAALTCLINPKAYAFMLAVFPAFILRTQQPLAARALVLGAIIAATQVVVYGAVALGVVTASRWTGGSPALRLWSARSVGTTLVVGALCSVVFAWRDTLPQPAAPSPSAMSGDAHFHKELVHDRRPAER